MPMKRGGRSLRESDVAHRFVLDYSLHEAADAAMRPAR
jgi:hypothetical protein